MDIGIAVRRVTNPGHCDFELVRVIYQTIWIHNIIGTVMRRVTLTFDLH